MKVFFTILVLASVLSSTPSFCQTLLVCYHANCFKKKTFEISSNTHNQVATFFSSVTSAADERKAIRYAVRELYLEAVNTVLSPLIVVVILVILQQMDVWIVLITAEITLPSLLICNSKTGYSTIE